jgi:hypothetical protein
VVVIKKEPNQLYSAVGTVAGLGHNARTCKKDTEDNSESELSSICTDQWVNSDEIEDA